MPKDPKYENIVQEYESGMPVKEMAKKYGVHKGVMYSALRLRGAKMKERAGKPFLHPKYNGIEKLYEAGATLRECAFAFTCSINSAHVALVRRGAKMRSIHDKENNPFYHGGPSSPKSFRHLIKKAIREGRIIRGPCEECGLKINPNGKQIHGHHDDYNRLFEIRWLCTEHHHKWHVKNKPIPAIK